MSKDDVHVLPIDDILEHQDSSCCWCDPKVEVIGANLIIIHNSFDGREHKEHLEE